VKAITKNEDDTNRFLDLMKIPLK